MNLGMLLTVLASASMLVSTAGFFMAARGQGQYFSLARRSYKYYTVFLALASGLLFYYFLTGDYSYKYVFDYSSSDLPLFYLISGFWAGQQGTYLLWAFLLAIMGYFILSKGKQYTSQAMFFYGIINLFFCVMLLALSPFEKLPFVQPDGSGLNPLLQDPWMVIHPPVIFIGYAAAAVPCVIALAAMMRNDYTDWVKITLLPVVLTAVSLAAGNILGGFWAYKTLGWGGYWAWDPVENSSFIPWMIALAAAHGLAIERRTGALRKTNLFLILFTFILVIYGTFMTRSGVLADFSVHSFVDLGANQYLVGFMLGFTALIMGIFALKTRSIKGPSVNMKASSQEFAMLISVWMLLLIGLVVLAGTSWPLITTALGKPGTADIAVYTRLTLPLTVIIGLFLGFTPFMRWSGGTGGKLLKKVILPVIMAAVITIVTFLLGVHSLSYLIYVFAAAFAFSSHLIVLKQYLPNRLYFAGPYLAHFGFAMMLFGFLGSSAYTTGEKLVIDRGSAVQAYGLEIMYWGMADDLETLNNEIILTAGNEDESHEVRPRFFWTEKMGGFMKKPYILRYAFYDLYFAPEQIQDLGNEVGVKIVRGETVTLGPYTVEFVEFDQTGHEMGSNSQFGAVLLVTDSAGNTERTVPALTFEPGKSFGHVDVPLVAGREDLDVRLEKILADERAIMLSVSGLTPDLPPDRLIIEVSKKPTMNLLWGGTILLLAGSLLSLFKRWELVGA